ncbi:hypothetical protein O181_000898 [Austropuccinia psidii MF-1]|uniref:Reverse transcriptase RNase H-like domain-containing protein n=1 Tax=Austropuccinia psidii MF-1 TaxID=1389203 RepID=A0A9Q3GB91_9BASI|nr:hypothetical protein [Austropuccinia psidii MF-1]
MECLSLSWALEKLHYYLDCSVFEVVTDVNSAKSLLSMKTPNRHILIWKIAIHDYRGDMIIIRKAGSIHKNADGFIRWELHNKPDNPDYVPANSIEGINITDVGETFLEEVIESFKKDKNFHILTSLLGKDCKDTALADFLDDIFKASYDK